MAKKYNTNKPKLVFLFVAILGIVSIVGVNFASADEVVSVLGPSEWKTSNSCVSGEYTMRSSVDWGPVRDGKRIIRNIKVLRGLKGDVKSGSSIDYTVTVETLKSNGKWTVYKTYGPATTHGPVSWNPANPPHVSYGGTRVRIKSGVDNDSTKGCTVVYQGIEPEDGQTPIAATQLPAAPINSGNWVSGGALSPSSTGLGLERGSYGSLDSINSKGYARISIGAVADGAGSSLNTCGPSTPVDPSVQWGTMYCFPYVSKWRLQGMTGSGSSGLGRGDIVIASQYNYKTKNDARLMVMNTTTGKYRYVTLVRPCGNGDGYCELGTGATGSGCKETHAGGLAWYKNYLLVADGNCYIAFDINNIYQTKDGSIVLPTTHYWHHTQPQKMLLSTAALDTTSGKPEILSTDYMKANKKTGKCGTRLVARWDLDPTTGDLIPDPGSQLASADTVLQTSSICEVQGIASYGGLYFMNSSQGTSEYMHRFRTQDTNPGDTKFLMPRRVPEGIYIDTSTSLVWSLVELETSDNNVRIFSMGLPSILD